MEMGKTGRRVLVLGFILALAGGCVTSPCEWWRNRMKVGPEYERPPAPVEEAWIDSKNPQIRSDPVDLSAWWTVFKDPILDGLIQTAYQNNLDVQIAGTRILQARAQRGIAVGELFPQFQQLQGSYSRNKISTNVANQQLLQDRFDNWQVGPAVSWEVDFWGRFRRGIEAADANLNASIENYDDVLVLLLGDVANTYVQMRTLQAQILLARQNVEIQRGSLGIANAQFKNGAVTEIDVAQATANLEQTESLIPPLEAALRQANNRLCTLLGIPPRDLLPELGPEQMPANPNDLIPHIPEGATIVVGIPADLLRRRPDVREAERRVAAQCALIGVAEADLYPALFLNGNINVQSEKLSNLFSSDSINASVGPSFQWNILNYGRILNNVRLQDAAFQQLVVTYQNAVLQANREVEDGIVGFLKAQEQTQDLYLSARSAKRSVDLAQIQYREGSINFNEVFDLEEFLVQQQLSEAAARGNIAANLISVYRALGGGWEIRYQDRLAAPVEQ